MSTATDIQKLQELISSQAVDLIAANADGITQEALTAEDGKLSLSLGFKLTISNHQLYCDGAIAFSRKFKDTVEGRVELSDHDQPSLPIETPADPVVTFHVEGKRPISAKQSVMKAALEVIKERHSAVKE